jgi:hypothetical protein
MKNERREKRFGAGGSRLKMEENWKRNFLLFFFSRMLSPSNY